jgi:hypothetical protein
MGWAWLGCSAGSFIRGDYQKSDTNGCLSLSLSPPAFDATHRVELRGLSAASQCAREACAHSAIGPHSFESFLRRNNREYEPYVLFHKQKETAETLRLIKNVQNYVLISAETFQF